MNSLSTKSNIGLVKRSINAAERLFSSIGRTSLTISDVMKVASQEHKYWSEYPLGPAERLSAWRHGFTSRDYVLLNLAENDPATYLSYLQQAKLVHPAVNDEYHDVLRNKVAFYMATRPYVECIPNLYGTIRNGTFEPAFHLNPDDRLPAIVSAGDDVIVKPIAGTMGRGVSHVTRGEDGFSVNGEPHTREELDELVAELDGQLVCEFVEQHEYAAAICPESTNTIRILTLEDPDTTEMFVASAVHRFGNDSTGPTDNWSGGGFAAPVDVDTGTLGDLATYSTERGLRRLSEHPDTGTRVAAEVVPEWDRILETVLDVAALHREIPYVGWDVVLTDDGPMILEGNAAPHLALQQLGHGLFDDERVERFFGRRWA